MAVLPLRMGGPVTPLGLCCCATGSEETCHPPGAGCCHFICLDLPVLCSHGAARPTETLLLRGLLSPRNRSFPPTTRSGSSGSMELRVGTKISPCFWQQNSPRQASAARGVLPKCLCSGGYIKTVRVAIKATP